MAAKIMIVGGLASVSRKVRDEGGEARAASLRRGRAGSGWRTTPIPNQTR